MIAWHFVDSTVPKIKRGFYCNDPALSRPFLKSTIRGIWLHAYFYGTPIIIWILEFSLTRSKNFMKKLINSSHLALRWFIYYFFTFISLIILMSTVKNLSGVQRPFFFDVCKPDLAVNCTSGSFVSSDFQCTNQNISAYILSESMRSFPSGHVVSVAYPSLVFMWYMQTRFSKHFALLTFSHLVCLLWLSVCSITRITDHWHHVSDVSGALIMTVPFVIYCVSIFFESTMHLRVLFTFRILFF